jgi:uncharacterized membrane protein
MSAGKMFSFETDPSAGARLLVSTAVGAITGVVVLLLDGGKLAWVSGWDAGAALYTVWMWTTIWPLDPRLTARRAEREDPGRVIADILLLSAAVVSLVAVGVVLIKAGNSHGTSKHVLVGLGILSVVIAWCVVHTVYTLRYAHLYYEGPDGGIDFNEQDRPQYSDFAYLAFTIGMTFQVSDTDLQEKEIRATALQHALLSYVFGVVIIALTINLVAGLTK